MSTRQIIEADLTWTEEGFEHGVQIAIEPDGCIGRVGRNLVSAARKLPNRAVLPGMINAHSHAFQRGLRGHGERFSQRAGSFWSWRETMYELVQQMDADTFYQLSRQAFGEMLAAGVTTVGEFHYFHHDASCDGYGFDEIVLRAAADAGVRIVLINAYYNRGGIDQPLAQGQLRFRTRSVDEYWQQMDRLDDIIDPATQSLGVAAHSIRAVSIDDIVALDQEASRRDLVFHIHIEEQSKEIDDCVAAHGVRPMALIHDHLNINPRFTAVHCTQTAAPDMQTLLEAGGNVCICPLTEANLGDGIPDLRRILHSDGCICLGTDSNARIGFTEEMRWLEYVQRLATRSRGVCVDESGACARKLWRIATINGARALGIRAGRIEPGYAADLVALDLQAPTLAGWTEDTLLDAFIFGSGCEAIAATCVAGQWTQHRV